MASSKAAMRVLALVFAAVFASQLALLSWAAARPPSDEVRSVHARELAAHRDLPPFAFPSPARRSFADAPKPRTTRVVYGYYPYWVSAWDQLRWDLLTHIVYFSLELSSDGTIEAAHGWPSTSFVETAHAHGVKVDVAFTLFSGMGIAAVCATPESRARAIGVMIDQMEAGGADGINLDFEGVPSTARDGFTAFVRELRAELTRRGHPDGGIGIAGPAVDWSDAFDLGALTDDADVFFIMGYDYHWGGAPEAGPVGQLRVGPTWRATTSISVERTLAHYTPLVSAERRARIVLGVPYYGEDWPTVSASLGAATTGDGSSRTYAAARRAIDGGRARLWDAESENPWYTYTSGGTTRQTWYEDEESLAAKYQLVLDQGIGGVGMWALGYDEDYPELWDTLDAYFTSEVEPLEGTRERPHVIDAFPFVDDADTRTAPSSWFNVYACAPSTLEYGREEVYAIELCQPGRLTAEVVDDPGVDIDLHLLSAHDEAHCLMRDDTTITATLATGRYWLVADTYVSSYVAKPGAFRLTVDFVPDAGVAGCREDEQCLAGTCVPFGHPPPASRGAELEGEVLGTIRPPSPPVTGMLRDEGGCACDDGAPRGRGTPWLALVMFVVVLHRKRRSSTR